MESERELQVLARVNNAESTFEFSAFNMNFLSGGGPILKLCRPAIRPGLIGTETSTGQARND